MKRDEQKMNEDGNPQGTGVSYKDYIISTKNGKKRLQRLHFFFETYKDYTMGPLFRFTIRI